MTWRGHTDPIDRLFACLPYLLPLVISIFFGEALFQQFPFLIFFLRIIAPIFPLALGLPGLVIFFMLYALVVRNSQLKHFLRFNTMQALLLDIGLSIVSLLFGLLPQGIATGSGSGLGFILSTIYSTLFLGTVTIVVYAWYTILQGKYPEVPILSEAAYYHTQY